MSHTSNINTYLSYSHIPLTEANYNEVDALIFAQLSYFSFEYIFTDYEKKKILLPEFARAIMKSPDYFKSYSEDKKFFIKELAECKRYYRCMIYRMRAIATDDTQWAAFTVDMDSGKAAVVAMRGTDGTTVGWKENFRMAHNMMGTGAQLESFRYLKNTESKRIYLTGHSKGGGNVCSAYVMCNTYIRDKVIRIDNFDGPGVNPEFAGNYADGYGELQMKLHNFYPQDSIIGMLLQDNPGVVSFIKSEVREAYAGNPILGQHDPFSFVVIANRFVETKQTGLSRVWNQVLDNLVAKTTNIQRFYLICALERIGVPALIAGEKESMAGNIARSICGFIKTSREEKEMLFQLVLEFIKSLIYSVKEWIAHRQMRGYNRTVV